MKFFERHPMIMIAVGITGISLSAIFVKYSQAPSVITAAYRLLWTVALMSPFVLGSRERRRELISCGGKMILLCAVSGIFLALHFVSWFESLSQTSVASSTAIVCTEVIWVALGYCLFLKGRLSGRAFWCIGMTLGGSLLIAMSDYTGGGGKLWGDLLALAAAVFSAVYTLIGRQARQCMSTAAYTYIVYVFCAVTLCASASAASVPFTGYGAGSVTVGFLLAVCSTLLGHSMFSWCLKFLSPSFVSASKLCEPAAAAFFAFFLFHETPTPLQAAGGAVTLLGVYLYSRIEAAQGQIMEQVN